MGQATIQEGDGGEEAGLEGEEEEGCAGVDGDQRGISALAREPNQEMSCWEWIPSRELNWAAWCLM